MLQTPFNLPEKTAYVYPVGHLSLGASFGNPELFATADRASNLSGAWCIDDQFYCEELSLHLRVDGEKLPPRETRFAPAYQTTTYTGKGVTVAKTFFIPYGAGWERSVFLLIQAVNEASVPQELSINLHGRFTGQAEAMHLKLREMWQQEKRVFIRIDGAKVVVTTRPDRTGEHNPSETRILQAPLAPVTSRVVDPGRIRLEYRYQLAPGEEVTLPFSLLFANEGEAAAHQALSLNADALEVFQRTRANLDSALESAQVVTPSRIINLGVAWSKVNTLRVQHHFPMGPAFTNDPPQDILVVRDAAWYAFGANLFSPYFSRGMLSLIARNGIEEGGKITEVVRCAENPPTREDYDLTLNDDTPLFILACHHHYLATKDEAFLHKVYPAMTGAANWMLQQKKDGLLHTTVHGTNVWGISGWRNIIPCYALDGAVTEINCEGYAALQSMAETAATLGQPEAATVYAREAADLKKEINRQLLRPESGLYLLAKDSLGCERLDITGDLVFPLLFGLADPKTEERILNLLHEPQFWTPVGVRTVGEEQPEYDPELGVGLLGGIWPNLTAWVAYAARERHPDWLVEAMENIYRLSEVPFPTSHGRVCPGEFPERLDGETWISRGMAFSPWMPPTYLWLALQGLAGITPAPDSLCLEPHLPASWSWLWVRNVPYAGEPFSFCFHQGVIHAIQPGTALSSSHPLELYDEDVTALVETEAECLALRRGDEVTVFLTSSEHGKVPFRLCGGPLQTATFPSPWDLQVFTLRLSVDALHQAG